MKLEEKIKYHQDKYYNGEAEITDFEFDALWNQLKKENPNSKLLKSVGETSWNGWPKTEHKMMMGSQDKFNNEIDFKDWLRVKRIKFPLILQHKLDGLSLELQYVDGKLNKAVTRGDGIIGDDITPNVKKMNGVPIDLKDKWTGSVRGEIILKNSVFNKYFKDSKNPRNMASGITKRKNGEETELLNLIVYDVQGEFTSLSLESDKVEQLKLWGFDVVETICCNASEEVIIERDRIVQIRESLDIAIDGIVLKQNLIVMSDLYRKRPEYQRAFKFETEEAVTKLLDIEWSRSGYNYTPVANLEPIDLMGSIVKRASLANLDNIKKLGVKIGDKVLIHKAGDIIPQILKVVEEGEIRGEKLPPALCEVCGTELIVTGARVYCPNLDCGGRDFHRLEKWIDKTGVKGFGPALMNHLFDNRFVVNIVDLYELDLDEILKSTNLKKATEKAFKKLYDIKELKLETFVSGFDIEGIGEGVVKFAVNAGYDTLEKLHDATVNDLIQVEGFSDGRAVLLYNAMRKLYTEMVELSNYVSIKKVVEIEEDDMGKLNGASFCFTGKLENMTRDEAAEKVLSKGGIVKSGVSKDLDFLVTNNATDDTKSLSAKLKKALTLGVKLITEGQFMKMLL